jgi:hypothetical protein
VFARLTSSRCNESTVRFSEHPRPSPSCAVHASRTLASKRLDGAVIRGPVPVKLVDTAASAKAGPLGVVLAQDAVAKVVGRREALTGG